MAAPSGNVGYGLLYPELLSRHGLLDILKQRYIQQNDLESQDKEELLKLYYKYILPLPQRKYRLNRRGRDMTKKQIIMAKKRRIANSSSASDGEPPSKKRSCSSTNVSVQGSTTSPSNRIKPPPSCINFDKKVIKLNSSSDNSSEEKVTKIVKVSAPQVKQSTICLNKEKDIDAKIKTCTDSNNIEMKDSIEINQETEPLSPKKKIKKIAWP